MIEEILITLSVIIGFSAIATVYYLKKKPSEKNKMIVLLASIAAIVIYPAIVTMISVMQKHAELSLVPCAVSAICGLITVVLYEED